MCIKFTNENNLFQKKKSVHEIKVQNIFTINLILFVNLIKRKLLFHFWPSKKSLNNLYGVGRAPKPSTIKTNISCFNFWCTSNNMNISKAVNVPKHQPASKWLRLYDNKCIWASIKWTQSTFLKQWNISSVLLQWDEVPYCINKTFPQEKFLSAQIHGYTNTDEEGNTVH